MDEMKPVAFLVIDETDDTAPTYVVFDRADIPPYSAVRPLYTHPAPTADVGWVEQFAIDLLRLDDGRGAHLTNEQRLRAFEEAWPFLDKAAALIAATQGEGGLA